MKLGLHLSKFAWPDGAPRLGPTLAGIASAADDAGLDRFRDEIVPALEEL
ncbi:hypothetical protein OHA21_29605 [Actinoplanes sp. NBC_00393]